MTATAKFYIVKRPAGCEILPLSQVEEPNPRIHEKWDSDDSPEMRSPATSA